MPHPVLRYEFIRDIMGVLKSVKVEELNMYTIPPKKLLMLNILDILRKYTDKDHRLSQKQILDKLKDEYCMVVDRKSVRRNLMNLMELGYEIEYEEVSREGGDIWSDFYLKREITDGEIRLLIDGLIFSRNVPNSQCKKLVKKLENLSNVYFKSRAGYICRTPDERYDFNNIFSNIELLDEAICQKKKISFKYMEYGTDKKKRIKKDKNGNERVYVVSPYQMAAKEGKYYLICNYDKYEDVSNYRVDRITDIKILKDKVKPFETLQWSDGKPLDLSTYMKEHIYMYSSENVRVKFKIVREMVSDVVDIFGDDVWFMGNDEKSVAVSANANERAMIQFAKNFAPDVEVLEPKELRGKVKSELKMALKVYE